MERRISVVCGECDKAFDFSLENTDEDLVITIKGECLECNESIAKKAYDDGYEEGQAYIDIAKEEAYENGLRNGYYEGYKEGSNEGIEQGYREGYDEGFNAEQEAIQTKMASEKEKD